MKKGFTLLEIMIVMVILGVLSLLISGNFITTLKKGRDAKRKADLEQIQRALEMYYEDKKEYPPTINFGSKLCETSACTSSEKVYMQKIPQDPSGGNYGYRSDGSWYRLYACLENNQQVLPYQSQNFSGEITCNNNCQFPSGNFVPCVWGISSPNTNP